MPRHQGFTLVELAIVMTIIGLLIGGILKGQELIRNARTKALIQEFQAITAATVTFKDKYAQLPGDISTATMRIPNCSAAATSCSDGDGDGKIGFHVIGSNIFVRPVAEGMESWQYWRHLALADLITGVLVTTDPFTVVTWGGNHLKSAWGTGGYQVLHMGNFRRKGHVLRLQTAVDINSFRAGHKGRNPITPRDAHFFDRKFDDGEPYSGTIMANPIPNNANRGCGSISNTARPYDPLATGKDCVLYYEILGGR